MSAGLGCFSVSFLVSLYYNTVLLWVLWFFLNSFQYPLPWSTCPLDLNRTGENPWGTWRFHVWHWADAGGAAEHIPQVSPLKGTFESQSFSSWPLTTCCTQSHLDRFVQRGTWPLAVFFILAAVPKRSRGGFLELRREIVDKALASQA